MENPRKQKIDEAAALLLKAVNAMLDIGYTKLSEDEQCACNWANMAREKLVRNIKVSSETVPYAKLVSKRPDVTVGGAGPAQQVRMDKAARRMANKLRKTGCIYF